MAILKGVIEEELNRLQRMEKATIEKINSLPKGRIKIRKINGNDYRYLQFREGTKVIDKYLKCSEEEFEKLKKQIELRKQNEKNLREIRKDIKIAMKVVRDGRGANKAAAGILGDNPSSE